MPFSAPSFQEKKYFFLIINININIEVQVIFTLLRRVIDTLILITLLKNNISLPFCSQYVLNSCLSPSCFNTIQQLKCKVKRGNPPGKQKMRMRRQPFISWKQRMTFPTQQWSRPEVMLGSEWRNLFYFVPISL